MYDKQNQMLKDYKVKNDKYPDLNNNGRQVWHEIVDECRGL